VQPLPADFQARFGGYLRDKAVPLRLHGEYKKWLRYYLDFCQKDRYSPVRNGSLPPFIRKLQEKKQTDEQQKQAVLEIALSALIPCPPPALIPLDN